MKLASTLQSNEWKGAFMKWILVYTGNIGLDYIRVDMALYINLTYLYYGLGMFFFHGVNVSFWNSWC
jgi:hypothetical protein